MSVEASEGGDWGLPGVADVIEESDVRVDAAQGEAEGATTEDEGVTVTDSCDVLLNDDALVRKTEGIVAAMRRVMRREQTRIERAFWSRAFRLRQSLRSAQQLRERLRGVRCVMDSPRADFVAPDAASRVSLLALLTLLLQCTADRASSSDAATLLEEGIRSYCRIDAATPIACYDIYRELYKLCEDGARSGVSSNVACTLMQLAERSGSLSGVLSCMTLVHYRSAAYSVVRLRVTSDATPPYFACSAHDNFIVRSCVLPRRTALSSLQCFSVCGAGGAPDALCVFARERGEAYLYDCLGVMNTRLRQRARRVVCAPGDCVALTLRDDASLLLLADDEARARETNGHHVPYRIIRSAPLVSSPPPSSPARRGEGEAGCATEVCVGVDRASRATSAPGDGGSGRGNDVLFASDGERVACLLCRPSFAAPARSRCYVAECALACDGRDVRLVIDDGMASGQALLREAHADHSHGVRALHFTERTTVSLGRVTLKEQLHPFCVELWVLPRSVSEPQTIFCIGDRSVDEILLELLPSEDGVVWRGGARTPQLGPSFATYNAPGRLASVERWWHVALNFTGTTWELYLDMHLVAHHPALTARAPLRQCACTLGRSFVGFIAEFRVWQVCRTASELRRDARRGLSGNEHGLVAYFPLNEGQGSVLLDLSPTAAHALLPAINSSAGTAASSPSWCGVLHCPVGADDSAGRRRVADFVPLALRDNDDAVVSASATSGVHFALTPEHYTIVVAGRKGNAIIFQYGRTGASRRVLRAQLTIELPPSWRLGGVSYNAAWQSLLCWAVANDAAAAQPPRLMVWDVMTCCIHDETAPCKIPSTLLDNGERDAWARGRGVLLRSARHAMRLLRPERYLADVSAWTVAMPPLVLDADQQTLTRLVAVAEAARTAGDDALTQATCILLHINLLLRLEAARGPGEGRRRRFEAELGCELYTGVSSVLAAAGASKDGSTHDRCVADALLRLAFLPRVASTGLLQVCCRCFLTTQACVEYICAVTSRPRSTQEEQLLACLLNYFSGLSACDELLQSAELAQSFYTALMNEAAQQLAQRAGVAQTTELRGEWSDDEDAVLRRVTRALEVFQEMLLVQAVQRTAYRSASSSSSSPLTRPTVASGLIMTYCSKLLNVCGEMGDDVLRAVRRGGVDARRLLNSLEASPVGALLPSFTLTLPYLPTLILSTCATKVQACRETLVGIRVALVRGAGAAHGDRGVDEAQLWLPQLGVALTFSLCLVGYSLMSATASGTPGMSGAIQDTPVLGAAQVTDDDDDGAEEERVIRAVGGWRVMALLKGGRRRGDGERDELIRNLQQGIGAAARAFDELRRSKPPALRVARDEALERAERNITAAFCALTVPTRHLREASPAALEPVYVRVQKVRAWLLARRQRSAGDVHAVSERAALLAQFEACCSNGFELATEAGGMTAARVHQQQLTFRPGSVGGRRGGRREASGGSPSQHQWRRFFRTWKAMRTLRTLLSAGESSSGEEVGGDIAAFLQSNATRAELERFIARRTTKAHYRLAGLHLLRQLVEEASLTPLLAHLLLPFMTRMLCGWHYADGVECCTSEDMARLRAAFFQLLNIVCDHYRTETTRQSETAATAGAANGLASPWATLLLSLLAAPLRPSDFREVRVEAIDALRILRASRPTQWGGFARRVNGDLPSALRETTLEGALAAASLIVGGSGLTLRSTGERGTCVAPCTWSALHRNATYYFEVHLIDLMPDAVCSIGVGLADYSLSRMPGWDSNSYALQSEGMLFKGGMPGHITDCSFRADDVVGCGWNVEKHEVYWSKNGKVVETCKVSQEEFAPLIGFAGRGIARVNFGAEAFVLQHLTPALPEQRALTMTNLRTSHDAWDTFYALSLRAALGLKAACASSGVVDGATAFASLATPLGADASVDHLARCVGQCLYTLSLDLRELLCRSPPVTDAARVEPLLLHCRTLVRLLARVPPGRVLPQATQLAEVMKESSLAVLRWAPGRTDYVDLLMSLLGCWFDVMHLVPPRVQSSQGDVGNALPLGASSGRSSPTATREAGVGVRGQTTQEAFLPTLLSLAARLCFVARDWLPGRGAHTPPSALTAVGLSEGVSWMALTLLQRLNCTGGDGGAAHSWTGALHGWLMDVLERASKPSSELLLALAILHGGARLVVPGDTVVLRRAQHLLCRASLVSYSVSDQTARVVLLSDEKARCRTVPLRLIDLVVAPDSDVDTFPRVGNAQHMAQARAVLALAERTSDELTHGGPPVSVELAATQAEMLAILWRCVDRGLVALPHTLVASLVALSETLESGIAAVLRGGATTTAAGASASPPLLPNVERLHMDKVVLEGCLLAVQGSEVFERAVLASSGAIASRAMASTGGYGDDNNNNNNNNDDDDDGTAQNDLLFAAESSDVEEVADSATASERVSSVMENYFAAREASEAEEEDDDDEVMPTPELRAELRRAFSHANGPNMVLDTEDGEEGNVELEESEELTESELITGDYLYEEYDDDAAAAAQLGSEEENNLGGYVPDGGAEEQFDGLHFSGGYLCIVANQPVGPNFTVDVQVRLLDVQRPQVLFMQCGALDDMPGCVGRASRGAMRCHCSLIARVNCGVVEFGWLRPSDASAPTGMQNGATAAVVSDLLLCRCPISPADVGQWLRLSFVQSGDSVSLYREGVLQETQRSVRYDLTPPSLLGAELYLGGGAPGVGRDPFTGDLKALHVFNTALRVAQLEQLHTFDGEDNVLPENAQSHLCIQLRATRSSFDNFARSSAALFINVLTEGDVGYLENSSSGARVRGGRGCAKEFDFGCDADEVDLHAVDVCVASNQLTRYLAQVQRRRLLSAEALLQAYSRCWRQLSCFYSICLLTAVLRRGDADAVAGDSNLRLEATTAVLPPSQLPPSRTAACASVVVAAGCTRRVVHFALFTGHERLCSMLGATLRAMARGAGGDAQVVSAAGLRLSSEALQYMLQVAQQEQHVRVFESAHPYKPTAKVLHEVHAPQRSFYQFFFDPRTLTSSLYLTFAADRGMSEVVVQAPAYTLTPFSLELPRVFMDHRHRTTNSQWGFKMTAVYDCQPQLRAMRLFHATLSAALDGTDSLGRLPFFHSTTCLELLAECAKVSTGKTRRIALACLTDLLLHAHLFTVSLPFFACLHELRHLAEKLAYRPLGTQLVQSRFVKVAYACYVMYSDALLYWSTGMNCAPSATVPAAAPVDEEAMFARWRQEQRQLYRQRGAEEHVTVQQLVESQALHVEWRPEHVCIVHSKLLRGALIATPALQAGRWYFEVRIWDTGNLFIGVLPCDCHDGARPESALLVQSERGVVAFNGHTGMLQRGGVVEVLSAPRVWQYKDHVGIVLDVTERLLHFYVNGVDTNVELPFITGSDAVGGATMFYPYLALEAGQSARMNFGGYFFAHAPPHGCLPLDPAYFGVGSPLPYNQLRAFHDLAAHLLTGGRHPLPAFVHDESNPFADSQERTGPAHVSVQAPDEVQVNLLDVMNGGIGFYTVAADCAVRAGAWYYEVTLRTQGVMQIGWRLKGDAAIENGGGTTPAPAHGVGDDATSWGVDLFRRVLWHDGKAETVTVPQRWTVDDVIGCALDLARREMTFFVNGRPISGGGTLMSCSFHKLPTGGAAEYVPALSLRAGNGVSLNFGSAPFKYKPDGFSALGVPDSWCERMDVYYNNEPLPIMARRHRILRELWCRLDDVVDAGTTASLPDCCSGCAVATAAVAALEVHRAVVSAVDAYCEETGKHYLQLTPTQLTEQLEKQGQPASLLRRAWASMEVLTALARVMQFVLPLLPLNTQRVDASTKLFLATRGLLFRSTRFGFVDAMLKETNVRTENRRIFINRAKARAPRHSIEDSVFGQTFDLMAQQMPRLFQTNKRFWSTTFLGEGAEDAGGPYREHIFEMCHELMSTLPLFVPTANNALNTGIQREALVPAASATSPYELAAFVFLGRLMGGAMRSEEPLSLFFPTFVWRYLCACRPLTEADLESVDCIFLRCIRELRELKRRGDAQEAFDATFDTECFVVRLSDHSTRELIPNGATTRVTYDRCEEYAKAMLQARLHEFDIQLDKMREGMLAVVPEAALLLLTPDELERRVCGKADYKVDELRKGTIYEGLTAEDRRVLLLWRALEDATPTQRRLFLRFVAGRDRLPVRLRILPHATELDPDRAFPRATTCFFAIELPDYSSLQVMKQRLYYSIENCVDIDTDFNARATDEREGPHLSVGTEEVNLDEITNIAFEE